MSGVAAETISPWRVGTAGPSKLRIFKPFLYSIMPRFFPFYRSLAPFERM